MSNIFLRPLTENCYTILHISLLLGIDSLFDKINCDRSPIVDMLGDTGVTETNMMQYLGIIEQRTNELLQLYAYLQAREAEKHDMAVTHPSLLGQGPLAPVSNINVVPPTTG